jgi:hypothetical protein
MKPAKPAKPCFRCGVLTEKRRDGRAVCLRCWVRLSELKADKDMRKLGKLKDSRGW